MNLQITEIKRNVKMLCDNNIWYPLSFFEIKAWVSQFSHGEEQDLAWLILDSIIYRNRKQLISTYSQSLKKASDFFSEKLNYDSPEWRSVFKDKGKTGVEFYFGPYIVNKDMELNLPGKSGEVFTRFLRDLNLGDKVRYPFLYGGVLHLNEGFIIVDDVSLTGGDLENCLALDDYNFLKKNHERSGVAVAFLHEDALAKLKNISKELNIFYGEMVSSKNGFIEISKNWIEKGTWEHEIAPIDLYLKICNEKGMFDKKIHLGWMEQGLLLAYDHGIPDNSLQLLWGESKSWKPLIGR